MDIKGVDYKEHVSSIIYALIMNKGPLFPAEISSETLLPIADVSRFLARLVTNQLLARAPEAETEASSMYGLHRPKWQMPPYLPVTLRVQN